MADLLLKQAGVAILPGTDIGSTGVGHGRISYVANMQTLEKGMDACGS